MSHFANSLIVFIALCATTLFPKISYALQSGAGIPIQSPAPTPSSGPIKVITSGPGEPLTYAPINTTACRVVEDFPGLYEYQFCASGNGSSIPICKFLSTVAITRVPNHDETFEVIEAANLDDGTTSHLTGFHYLQLWNHSGCTLIYANEQMVPTWKGANTYMSDSHTIILGFHTGSVGLLKKIQDFPIYSPSP